MRTQNHPTPNSDLWAQLLELCERPGYEIEFRWVRGHAGNIENERCDRLASEAASAANLPVDAGYETDHGLLTTQRALATQYASGPLFNLIQN